MYKETFPQIGLALGYFAYALIGRDGDIPFGLKIFEASKTLNDRYGDVYTTGRHLALSSLFIHHLTTPIRATIEPFYAAIDDALISGDRHLLLACIGSVAQLKLFSGDNLGDIEAYCAALPEDLGDWTKDVRSSSFLIGARQAVRALEGKTWADDPNNVFTDDEHTTSDYLAFLAESRSGISVSRVIYLSYSVLVLYLYGHYFKATEISNEIIPQLEGLWSMRVTRLVYYIASLAIMTRLRDDPILETQTEELIAIVEKYNVKIKEWQTECDANYLMWSLVVDAQLAEHRCQYHIALENYEAAVDHAQVHDLNLDLAMITEIQAAFFMRRGARRAAVGTMKDAMAVYSRIGAIGKVEHITMKHEYLLNSCNSLRAQDAATQTELNPFEVSQDHLAFRDHDDQLNARLASGEASERTKAWISPRNENQANPQNPAPTDLGLDILDLTSILKFSQAISSELDIDKLLVKMIEITLSSASSQSDMVHVVTQDDGRWWVAASGTADGVKASVS